MNLTKEQKKLLACIEKESKELVQYAGIEYYQQQGSDVLEFRILGTEPDSTWNKKLEIVELPKIKYQFIDGRTEMSMEENITFNYYYAAFEDDVKDDSKKFKAFIKNEDGIREEAKQHYDRFVDFTKQIREDVEKYLKEIGYKA